MLDDATKTILTEKMNMFTKGTVKLLEQEALGPIALTRLTLDNNSQGFGELINNNAYVSGMLCEC